MKQLANSNVVKTGWHNFQAGENLIIYATWNFTYKLYLRYRKYHLKSSIDAQFPCLQGDTFSKAHHCWYLFVKFRSRKTTSIPTTNFLGPSLTLARTTILAGSSWIVSFPQWAEPVVGTQVDQKSHTKCGLLVYPTSDTVGGRSPTLAIYSPRCGEGVRINMGDDVKTTRALENPQKIVRYIVRFTFFLIFLPYNSSPFSKETIDFFEDSQIKKLLWMDRFTRLYHPQRVMELQRFFHDP